MGYDRQHSRRRRHHGRRLLVHVAPRRRGARGCGPRPGSGRMSAARPVAAHESSVILLATARQGRRFVRSRSIATVIAIFTLCLLGLIGSFADSAVARTGLLLVDPPYPGSADDV